MRGSSIMADILIDDGDLSISELLPRVSPILNLFFMAQVLYDCALAPATLQPLLPPTWNCVALAMVATRAKHANPRP
jgi:hypothetical protein